MNYHPPLGYSFSVTFLNDGNEPIGDALKQSMFDTNFKEVSGLTSEVSVDKIQEGGVNDFQHPLPKPASFGNITLKRGLLVKSELAHWMYDALENFNIVPKDLIIVLHGPLLVPIAAWNILNAYPIKWEVSGFNAMDNAIVMETIELTCRKHRRVLLETNENLQALI